MQNNTYDVLIIGVGASGSALAYTLCRYTNIKRIVVVEKYDKPGQVNTKASNNSQTLHVGDIETNYTIDKVRTVKPASMMTVAYANMLPSAERNKILKVLPKMVLGIGTEVPLLEQRFNELRPLFPELQKLYGPDIAKIEPNIMNGRNPDEKIIALYNPIGYAVDFEYLSQSFITEAQKCNSEIDIRYQSEVQQIEKCDDGLYMVHIKGDISLRAKVVIVDADSYSLLFAKQLGYGMEYSLIPIGGTFYFTEQLLQSKVYTVQKPGLPFAAAHGDPDLHHPNLTRWGPTARFYPALESHKFGTSGDYFRSSGLNRMRTWKSFFSILLKKVMRKYLFANMLYELPVLGKWMFVSKNIRKIIPTIRNKDVRIAKGYGGMRLQRVDTRTHELQLGEGKIVGNNIIFNMTPSPGASVALYNAYRDAEQITTFLGEQFLFSKEDMEHDLITSQTIDHSISVSLPVGYAS